MAMYIDMYVDLRLTDTYRHTQPAYLHTCMNTYTYISAYMYIHTEINIDSCLPTYKLIYMNTSCMHAFINKFMHIHSCIQTWRLAHV